MISGHFAALPLAGLMRRSLRAANAPNWMGSIPIAVRHAARVGARCVKSPPLPHAPFWEASVLISLIENPDENETRPRTTDTSYSTWSWPRDLN
jgi:hypothetical protein